MDMDKERKVLLQGGLILLGTFFAGTLIAYWLIPFETRLFGSMVSGVVGLVLFSLFVVPKLSKTVEQRIWAYSALSMGPPLLLSFPLLLQFNANGVCATEPRFFSLVFATAIPFSSTFGFFVFEVLSSRWKRFGGFKTARIGGRIVVVFLAVACYVLVYNLTFAVLVSSVAPRYIILISLLVASLVLATTVAAVRRVKEFLTRLEQGNW
jgi:hypothetical protein